MSQWNHSLCDRCWERREPTRVPVRVTEPDIEYCCGCGVQHESGIYVRAEPAAFVCHGQHRDVEENPHG